jgi:hypothetical protein
LINLIVAGTLGMIVMVGMLQPYWFSFLPDWLNNKVFLFFLTTPIVFGPARQFFVHSWNGLRKGVTDMNLLYATGIAAAYGIAVINTFWPDAGFGGRKLPFMKLPPCHLHHLAATSRPLPATAPQKRSAGCKLQPAPPVSFATDRKSRYRRKMYRWTISLPSVPAKPFRSTVS